MQHKPTGTINNTIRNWEPSGTSTEAQINNLTQYKADIYVVEYPLHNWIKSYWKHLDMRDIKEVYDNIVLSQTTFMDKWSCPVAAGGFGDTANAAAADSILTTLSGMLTTTQFIKIEKQRTLESERAGLESANTPSRVVMTGQVKDDRPPPRRQCDSAMDQACRGAEPIFDPAASGEENNIRMSLTRFVMKVFAAETSDGAGNKFTDAQKINRFKALLTGGVIDRLKQEEDHGNYIPSVFTTWTFKIGDHQPNVFYGAVCYSFTDLLFKLYGDREAAKNKREEFEKFIHRARPGGGNSFNLPTKMLADLQDFQAAIGTSNCEYKVSNDELRSRFLGMLSQTQKSQVFIKFPMENIDVYDAAALADIYYHQYVSQEGATANVTCDITEYTPRFPPTTSPQLQLIQSTVNNGQSRGSPATGDIDVRGAAAWNQRVANDHKAPDDTHMRCFNCDQLGHRKANCPNPFKPKNRSNYKFGRLNKNTFQNVKNARAYANVMSEDETVEYYSGNHPPSFQDIDKDDYVFACEVDDEGRHSDPFVLA